MLPFVLDVPRDAMERDASVLLLVHVGAVSTALGFLLWIAVLRWLPAGTASLNMFAIPVIALVSSMPVFGERLAPNEWIGIACIGAGLAMITVNALVGARRRASLAEPTAPVPLD